MSESFFVSNLCKDGRHNNYRDLWRYVRSECEVANSIPPLKDGDGNSIFSQQQKADLLNTCYSKVFSVTENDPQDPPVARFRADLDRFSFSASSISKWITKMQKSGSINPDGFSVNALKMFLDMFSLYLTKLFQKSISMNALPASWKMAHVCPIFKKGDRSAPENYRPISLTSGVCRIFEHLIADNLNSCFSKMNFFFRGQHGFQKGYSCESQLTGLAEEISKAIDTKSQIDVVFLDFEKAFDKVPHFKLNSVFSGLGIDPSVVNWIGNFLRMRKQKVKLEQCFSGEKNVTSGVPQGSVLGSLAFMVFGKSLHQGIFTMPWDLPIIYLFHFK